MSWLTVAFIIGLVGVLGEILDDRRVTMWFAVLASLYTLYALCALSTGELRILDWSPI